MSDAARSGDRFPWVLLILGALWVFNIWWSIKP
jgi:hypothetical protein